MEHLKSKFIPYELDENMYILIYRKLYACIRHEVFKVMIENLDAQRDPVKAEEVKLKFKNII